MPAILAVALLSMVAFIINRLSSPEPIAAGNKDIFYFMCGQITTMLGVAIGYWYNTTFASKAKDKLIAESVPAQRSNNDAE